ncbi:MAG: aminopeptidase P family protein [Lachnospiraceae bacterium]|nr:aminopeptidase P family protein [Lachnospiraceae bacterium]
MVITMENKVILERLQVLRECMKENGIDFYMMPTADFHSSEYVNDYFKVREYFSNFSGSNGTLVVWQEGAGLWTDGRYYIQAEKELDGTTIDLYRMQEKDVPTIEELLCEKMQAGQTLGFDGRVVSASEGRNLEKKLAEKQVNIAYAQDLAETIWTDRPAFPAGKVTVLSEEIAGESVSDKLARTREKMAAEGADALMLPKLDDLMWLLNIRGCDVECNPVAMSYGYITADEVILFIQEKALDETVKQHFAENGITVKEYNEIVAFLQGLSLQKESGCSVWVDTRCCSYTLYKILAEGQKLIEKRNPTELLKAVKNAVEMAQMEQVYLKDSVALTKFIYWLKTNIGKAEINEITAADRLEAFRREIPEFLDLSFPTIAGYGSNGAIVHYEATPESCAELKPEGLFLVDSGGQYVGGTTDVTRTIVLGPVTDEMKRDYTLVAAGTLQLAAARWLYGCTGRSLDILARQPLWNQGLDFKHGTGHGIGYMLNVHEGPQSVHSRYVPGGLEAVLEEGMVISDEPGFYVAGSHGIRIENVVMVKKDVQNEYGQFMHFDTLTWVPLDMEAIDEQYLNDTTKALLRDYQQKVFEKVAPFLTEEEREWLKTTTV